MKNMDETIGTDRMDEMKFENQGTDQAPGDGLVCRGAESLSGLTSKEVEERMAGGLVNVSHITTDKTTGQIVASNLFTYFNLIFLILAVLLCLVGSYRNLTFLPVVIGNTVIGILQELRAKRVLDKMNMLNAPHAVAVRDGRQIRLPSEELVHDDVVLLSAGDQICADAKVLSGNLSVNESLLTGEADFSVIDGIRSSINVFRDRRAGLYRLDEHPRGAGNAPAGADIIRPSERGPARYRAGG